MGGGAVYYETLGAAPDRTFVVQWDTHAYGDSPDRADFRAVLHEGSSHIDVCYAATTFGDPELDAGLDATSDLRARVGHAHPTPRAQL